MIDSQERQLFPLDERTVLSLYLSLSLSLSLFF